ncbi:carbohydrate kinase FGGY, putative [Babesia caballi]|uniref:Carbohydrate kinase FGGY, putative n=1 Tax=Babesia caballi TaxID=5871 RepID=A0AAV4LLE0_BABCB|nr:carbohydrate kinase FGGY, putative [Babesia caballi]
MRRTIDPCAVHEKLCVHKALPVGRGHDSATLHRRGVTGALLPALVVIAEHQRVHRVLQASVRLQVGEVQLPVAAGAAVDAAEVDLGPPARRVDDALQAEGLAAAERDDGVVEEVVADAAAQAACHALRFALAQAELALDALVGRLGEEGAAGHL